MTVACAASRKSSRGNHESRYKVDTHEEESALVQRAVDYATTRGESFESGRPRLLWAAGYQREPIVAALRTCREGLAASPASVSLQQSAAMLDQLAHGSTRADAHVRTSHISGAPQELNDTTLAPLLKPVSVEEATE